MRLEHAEEIKEEVRVWREEKEEEERLEQERLEQEELE